MQNIEYFNSIRKLDALEHNLECRTLGMPKFVMRSNSCNLKYGLFAINNA